MLPHLIQLSDTVLQRFSFFLSNLFNLNLNAYDTLMAFNVAPNGFLYKFENHRVYSMWFSLWNVCAIFVWFFQMVAAISNECVRLSKCMNSVVVFKRCRRKLKFCASVLCTLAYSIQHTYWSPLFQPKNIHLQDMHITQSQFTYCVRNARVAT